MIFQIINFILKSIGLALFGAFQKTSHRIFSWIANLADSKKFKSFIILTRPVNIVLGACFFLVMMYVSGASNLYVILIAASCILLVTGAGNILNDYYDIAIDKINKPERPLPSKMIKPETAYLFAIALFVSALAMASTIGMAFFLFVLGNSILLWYYDAKGKKQGFVGNIIVSYLTTAIFITGMIISRTYATWVLAGTLGIFAFLLSMGREIIKDMEDIEGDKKQGIKTLPTVYGLKKSGMIAGAILACLVLITPLPYLLGLFSVASLYVFGSVNIIIVYVIYAITRNPTKKTATNGKNLLKLVMFIALIGIIICSYVGGIK
jgi:geranylgeranylglycerol-phosphate geranylgeranyltransferase